MNNYLFLLVVVAFSSGVATVIGAAGGLLVRNLPHKFHDVMLGAASGVMLAAAVLGLIFPAAEMEQRGALIMAVCGVFAGAAIFFTRVIAASISATILFAPTTTTTLLGP